MTKQIRKKGAMPWFKFYGQNFRSNPTLSRMSVAHRFAYVILLCLAGDSQQRGEILLDDEDIASEVSMCREDWLSLKAKFKARGLIDFTCNAVTLLLWDEEQNTQYKYPSDRPEASRERAAKYRAKKKTEKEESLIPLVTTGDALVIPANVTSVTRSLTSVMENGANSENTVYESVTAKNESANSSRIVTNFTRDDFVISADFTQNTETVTSAENTLYEVITGDVTRDFVTSVTSDFEVRHECVTSRHEESRGITSAGSLGIKPFQERVTSVTTQERDIDINIELRKKENIERGSTNVDLSASAALDSENDGRLQKSLLVSPDAPVDEPIATLELGSQSAVGTSIEDTPEPNKTAPKKSFTLAEAVEILKTDYNRFKPQNWAVCQTVSPKRLAKLKKVIEVCGGLRVEGVDKARVLMESALLSAAQNDFWGQQQSGGKFDLDTLLREDRIYGFSERWQDSQAQKNVDNPNIQPPETPLSRSVRETLERRLTQFGLMDQLAENLSPSFPANPPQQPIKVDCHPTADRPRNPADRSCKNDKIDLDNF